MRLEQILEPVAAELAAVEERVSSLAAIDMPVVSEAIGHVVRSGGKRLRPACLLLAAGIGRRSGSMEGSACPNGRGGAEKSPQTIELAATVEIIHTASLVHDDIVDAASVRRGRQSLHARWDEGVALLVGDLLYSRVFRDMARNGQAQALEAVAGTVHRMVLGELAEACARDKLSLTESEYFEVVGNKTASLFSCATYLGALAGGLPPEDCERLRRYGERLGVAYQIVDDVLDLYEGEADLGKPVGADLRDGKVTLPVIHALWQDARAGGDRVASLFRERDGEGLREAVLETGSACYAVGRGEEAGREAASHLEGLPLGACLRSLAGMVEFVVGRGRDALARCESRRRLPSPVTAREA